MNDQTTDSSSAEAALLEGLEDAFTRIRKGTRTLPAAARRDVDDAARRVLDGIKLLLEQTARGTQRFIYEVGALKTRFSRLEWEAKLLKPNSCSACGKRPDGRHVLVRLPRDGRLTLACPEPPVPPTPLGYCPFCGKRPGVRHVLVQRDRDGLNAVACPDGPAERPVDPIAAGAGTADLSRG